MGRGIRGTESASLGLKREFRDIRRLFDARLFLLALGWQLSPARLVAQLDAVEFRCQFLIVSGEHSRVSNAAVGRDSEGTKRVSVRASSRVDDGFGFGEFCGRTLDLRHAIHQNRGAHLGERHVAQVRLKHFHKLLHGCRDRGIGALRCCFRHNMALVIRSRVLRKFSACSVHPVTGSYQLIAAEVSLYSGKARAYLRYKGVPFEEVLSTRPVIQRVVRPKTGMAMIPVLLTPEGEAVQDTTAIIDHIEAKVPEPAVRPATPVLALASSLLELYGDEWLLMPAMSYRWHYKRNMPLILSEFGALVAPRLPRLLHPVAGLPLALYFGGNYGRALGISKKNRAAIEASYERFLADFDRHLGEHPYLLGDRPCEGDFGFMGPLYAHLYRDPAPGALMRRVAPQVADWVERMNAPRAASDERGSSSFAADDEVPTTLDPLFRRFFAEHWPVVRDTFDAVDRWVKDNPGAPRIKRFVGEHTFAVEGVSHPRWIQSFTQWMAQRCLTAYAAMNEADRERAEAWLRRVGGGGELARPLGTWVRRVDNRLERDPTR